MRLAAGVCDLYSAALCPPILDTPHDSGPPTTGSGSKPRPRSMLPWETQTCEGLIIWNGTLKAYSRARACRVLSCSFVKLFLRWWFRSRLSSGRVFMINARGGRQSFRDDGRSHADTQVGSRRTVEPFWLVFGNCLVAAGLMPLKLILL